MSQLKNRDKYPLSLQRIVSEKIAKLKDKNIHRTIHPVERSGFPYIMRDGRQVISFACNDYLGLSQHPEVKEAAIKAVEKYGAGAGASRLVSGSSPLYEELEELVASGKWQVASKSACIFGSGYLANVGVIQALVGSGDLIVADKLVHASMIDGAKLSGAKFLRFNHNDANHLKELLNRNRGEYNNCLILTESVFSMDGDRAPITEIAVIADEFDCWLVVDEAHDLDASGQWPVASNKLKIGTLSKTLGSYGGYVCGNAEVIEYIKSSARSLIFSTALPPATLAAAIAAIKMIRKNPELLQEPLKKAKLFCHLTANRELRTANSESQIVPLIVGDADKATAISAALMDAGFYIPAIRPPTVPEGTSRLRLSFSSMHNDKDIERMADALRKF